MEWVVGLGFCWSEKDSISYCVKCGFLYVHTMFDVDAKDVYLYVRTYIYMYSMLISIPM